MSNPLVSDGSVWESTTATSPPSAACASRIAGSSRRHGSHQYAHRLTTIGRPAWILPSVVVDPSSMHRTMNPATGPSVVAGTALSRQAGSPAEARVPASTPTSIGSRQYPSTGATE